MHACHTYTYFGTYTYCPNFSPEIYLCPEIERDSETNASLHEKSKKKLAVACSPVLRSSLASLLSLSPSAAMTTFFTKTTCAGTSCGRVGLSVGCGDHSTASRRCGRYLFGMEWWRGRLLPATYARCTDGRE